MKPNISLREFAELLRIDRHRLDDELELQAELLHRISEEVVKAKSKAVELKDLLDRLEGDIYSDAKQHYPKATVPELQGITLREPQRIAAFRNYHAARSNQESWEGLHDAWKSRGFALRGLIDLRLANYYTSDSGSHKEGREALARARREKKSTNRRRKLL